MDARPDVWTCLCEAKRLEDVITVGCDSQEHWSLSNIVAKEVCWKRCVWQHQWKNSVEAEDRWLSKFLAKQAAAQCRKQVSRHKQRKGFVFSAGPPGDLWALPGMQTRHPGPILRSRPDVWTCPCEAKRLEDAMTAGCDSQEHWSLSNIVAKEVCWKKCVWQHQWKNSVAAEDRWLSNFLAKLTPQCRKQVSRHKQRKGFVFSAGPPGDLWALPGMQTCHLWDPRYKIYVFFHFHMLNFPRVLSK